MKIKRFQAADVRQAIKEVREVMGPDAVILSNTRVDGGIEIVAATDYDESQFRRQNSNTQKKQDAVKVEINPNYHADIAQPTSTKDENIWSQEPTLVQMRKEMSTLRDILENQLSDLTWKDMTHKKPMQAQLLKRFLRMGIDAELAKQITQQIPNVNDLETAWRHALGALAVQISIADDDILSSGGIYALVGPTGVGKTTTIAKLAARCALKHGARNVALVTTDCYRIGGQEQLQSYAQILGVPIRVARSHQELSKILDQLSDRKYILIDTAGVSQRDIKLTEKLAILQQQTTRIKNYLTISATTQASNINAIINAYSMLEFTGCILTKTDEASSLGAPISALIHKKLPLVYITNGQQVPEDLSLARPNSLVSEANQLINNEQQLDAEISSSYGGFAAYG